MTNNITENASVTCQKFAYVISAIFLMIKHSKFVVFSNLPQKITTLWHHAGVSKVKFFLTL